MRACCALSRLAVADLLRAGEVPSAELGWRVHVRRPQKLSNVLCGRRDIRTRTPTKGRRQERRRNAAAVGSPADSWRAAAARRIDRRASGVAVAAEVAGGLQGDEGRARGIAAPLRSGSAPCPHQVRPQVRRGKRGHGGVQQLPAPPHLVHEHNNPRGARVQSATSRRGRRRDVPLLLEHELPVREDEAEQGAGHSGGDDGHEDQRGEQLRRRGVGSRAGFQAGSSGGVGRGQAGGLIGWV